jgi:ferric-dicitrate binding protein FerR (iron transport regulator)
VFQLSTLFKGRRLHSFPSIAFRYAVILIFATMIGGFFVRGHQAEPQAVVEPTLRDIYIPRGQRGNVTLSDGTHVVINADSRVTLPTSFGTDSRQVYLEGEAYFDVAKDPSRPFRIMVNGAQVEVIGTRFAIRSIPGDLSVQTVVEEGIVALTTDHGDAQKKVLVTKGMIANLDLNNRVITTKLTRDLDLYLSWKDGYLKFDRTPLRVVAEELERKYDVTIRFASDEIEDLELTAELKSRTIVNVLDVISTSLGLQARMEQDTVLFSQAAAEGDGTFD